MESKTMQGSSMKRKNKRTNYAKDKSKAMFRWDTAYFSSILKYYAGHNNSFIAKAIQMDRPNLLRKLKELKLGTYADKA